MADGIPIVNPPSFVPSNVPPKLRQKYLRLVITGLVLGIGASENDFDMAKVISGTQG